MTDTTQNKVADNKIRLTGALNFDTVPALWRSLSLTLPSMPSIEIDLADVGYCDSGGVALLLECTRLARAEKKLIRFTNMSAQLLALARATAVDGILPIYDDNNKNSSGN